MERLPRVVNRQDVSRCRLGDAGGDHQRRCTARSNSWNMKHPLSV